MSKLYSGVLRAAAESYLVEMLTGEREMKLNMDADYQSSLISAAMHIVIDSPWGFIDTEEQVEKGEWGDSPNPGGDSDEEKSD